jgi:hypothetical protein
MYPWSGLNRTESPESATLLLVVTSQGTANSVGQRPLEGLGPGFHLYTNDSIPLRSTGPREHTRDWGCSQKVLLTILTISSLPVYDTSKVPRLSAGWLEELLIRIRIRSPHTI